MKGTVWIKYTFADGYIVEVRGGFGSAEFTAEERRHGRCVDIQAETVIMPSKAVRV